jgi:hypothetical protein
MSHTDGGKTTLCYMHGSLSLDEDQIFEGEWSYDDPAECDDEPEESWLFEYKVVDQTCNPDDRTETNTFRGTFLHKDGVAKDEFVLHCDTIDSPSTYTGRGESDFGEYTIVGECINGELDSAEFTFRKLV